MDTDGDSALIEALVSQFYQSVVQNYVALSTIALTLFDYGLTFGAEISCIWTGKPTLTKTLFVINRYFFLVFQLSVAFLYFYKPATDLECSAFNYVNYITPLFGGTAVNIIFVLRTFAIYQRNFIVLLLLTVPASLTIASNIWLVTASIRSSQALPQQLQVGPYTCFIAVGSGLSPLILNWTAGFVFDAAILLLTLFRTGRLALEARRLKMRNSIAVVLLRDGIIYYVVGFGPTLLVILFYAISLKGGLGIVVASECLAQVADTLSSLMASRLILNLNQAANNPNGLESNRSRTGIAFAVNTFIGNIGASLRVDSEPVDIEMSEREGDARGGNALVPDTDPEHELEL